jgi:hypothetical protein
MVGAKQGKESNSAMLELDWVFPNRKLEMVSGQRETWPASIGLTATNLPSGSSASLGVQGDCLTGEVPGVKSPD